MISLLLAAIAYAGMIGCGMIGCTAKPQPPKKAFAVQPAVELAAIRPEVERFCGSCHAVPSPDSFPKDRWPHEVERGYEFYLLSERTDLVVPRRSDVVEYYRQLAPDRLTFSRETHPQEPSRFSRCDLAWPANFDSGLAVAHILAAPGGSTTAESEFVVCDMQVGKVTWAFIGSEDVRVRSQVQLANPDHVCRTDLDQDGRPDYLVCDLGSFLPEDHGHGRVVWLKPREDAGGLAMDETVLLDKVGRVTDAQPADFDSDGDLDIIVAAFGWHTTGGVLLLRQTGAAQGRLQVEPTVIDRRSGAIHVPVADLNGDGRPDFVVLYSQEHESVEACINRGDGTFGKHVLFRAPDPSYGSTGIQLIDLDRDGDQDVLYTNGDTFDSYLVKPYHSIRWLENMGDSTWQDHLLAHLPGVCRALAGDLDGDGDLDVAACSFIPGESIPRHPEIASFASLIWLQQQAGKFVRYDIETNHCVHAAMELADVNHDGALDLLVGNFGQSPSDRLRPFTVWLNQGQLSAGLTDERRFAAPGSKSSDSQ